MSYLIFVIKACCSTSVPNVSTGVTRVQTDRRLILADLRFITLTQLFAITNSDGNPGRFHRLVVPTVSAIVSDKGVSEKPILALLNYGHTREIYTAKPVKKVQPYTVAIFEEHSLP